MAGRFYFHQRRSVRLDGFDYSSPAIYFLTLNTCPGDKIFADIIEDSVRINQFGGIVRKVWDALPVRFPNIRCGEYAILPDHFHGLISIISSDGTVRSISPGAADFVGAIHELPRQEAEIEDAPVARCDPTERSRRRKMRIPLVAGFLKMNSAKAINRLRGSQGAHVWQRNYFERIIRSQKKLSFVRKYMRNNPMEYCRRKKGN